MLERYIVSNDDERVVQTLRRVRVMNSCCLAETRNYYIYSEIWLGSIMRINQSMFLLWFKTAGLQALYYIKIWLRHQLHKRLVIWTFSNTNMWIILQAILQIYIKSSAVDPTTKRNWCSTAIFFIQNSFFINLKVLKQLNIIIIT